MKMLKINDDLFQSYANAVSDFTYSYEENETVLSEQIKSLQQQYFTNVHSDKIKKVPPIEWHPYNDYSITDQPVLIVGTFPPTSYFRTTLAAFNAKLDKLKIEAKPVVDFYYGNMASLWKYLDISVQENDGLVQRSAEQERVREVLMNKGIGITDIILACQRKKITSPADSNLYNIIPNVRLLKELSRPDSVVKRIIFTSSGWGIYKQRNSVGKFLSKHSATSLFFESLALMGAKLLFKVNGVWVRNDTVANCERIDTDLANRVVIDVKWFLDGVESPAYDLVLLPSPSGASSINLTNTYTFKKWLKWRFGQPGIEILERLNGEMKGLNDKARQKFRKKEKFNHRLHQSKLIKANEDYDTLCKSELYGLAVSSNQNEFDKLISIDNA